LETLKTRETYYSGFMVMMSYVALQMEPSTI
jgi:hypothetical protein